MKMQIRNLAFSSVVALLAMPSQADQVILDDLIVDGSACIGMDCVNGESFGFDTLRFKENNLRIHIDDTSNSASFPANDWRFTFNDSTNGGGNYFSVDDATAGRTPFKIEAGAPNNSLYVEADGDIGVKTSNPVVDVHVVEGNTPTLRLEQDGSSGFAAQSWDVAGNEANFFIRDVSNGSKLPLRIKPNAPENSIYIDTDGVGFGTSNALAPIHSQYGDNSYNVGMILHNTDATNFTGLRLKIGDGTHIDFNNSGGSFKINADQAPGAEFEVQANGNAVLAGTLTQNSDVNAKDQIHSVDQLNILDKVMALPVTEWSYKDEPGVRHVGPMAQDFYAAFGLGASEKGISSIDTGGIALAAIQGVKDEKDAEIAALKAALAREVSARRESLAAQEQAYAARILELEMMLSEVLRRIDDKAYLGAVTN